MLKALQRRGVHVTVVSSMVSQPAMVADELRRQADAFVDLAELKPRVGRVPSERMAPRKLRQQSLQFASRAAINVTDVAE